MSTPRSLDVPVTTRARRVEIRGTRLAVLDTPPARESPAAERGAVVLVPGITGSKEDFLEVLEPLASTGRRVVTYDQRGQYESPGDADPAKQSVPELAADLLALADELELGQPHLVGHSFGAFVARWSVLTAADRFRSLVLLDSGAAAVQGDARAELQRFVGILLEHGMTTVWEGMQALNRATGVPPIDDPVIADFMYRRFMANAPASLVAIAEALLTEPDRLDAVRETGLPLLVAHGADEPNWPPALQALMAARLRCPRVVIEGAAHSPAVEQPKRTADALASFWAGVEAPRGLPTRPRKGRASRAV